MSFTVIKTGGKQYLVKSGDVLKIEKLPKPENGKIVFDQVLMVNDGKKIKVGNPFIEGATLEAEFVEEGRGRKIKILKYKNKTRYRKRIGHKQPYTKISVKNA